MTSERSTESIIDLLYGELSPQEEAELREEIQESAELRAEFESYEDLLGDVRAAMPEEEVPSSVHDSIMEAAREGVAEQVAEEARAARKPPAERKAGGGSLWDRVANSQFSQIGLVAAVLLAGAFVFKFIDLGGNRMQAYDEGAEAPAPIVEEARQNAVADNVKGESAPQKMAEEPAIDDGEFAQAETALPAEEAAPTDEAEIADEPTGRTGTQAQQQVAELDTTRGDTRRERDKNVQRRRRARKKPRPKKKKTARSASAKKSDSSAAIFGGDSDEDAKKNAPVLDSLGKGAETKKQEQANAPSKDAYQAPSAKPAAPEPEPRAAAEGALAEKAEEEESREQYRPPSGSIDSVEESYRANDYSGTISSANDFIEEGEGTRTDRARAMHLKAQALIKMGRLREADRVLKAIQNNYPSYQTRAVNEQRADIARKLRPKRSKRKSKPAPAEEMLDLEDSAPSSTGSDY